MKNQVRWQREANGTCVPYMLEDRNGAWMWRRYNSSKIHAVKNKYPCSEGMEHFQVALKAGYEVVELKENF